MNELTQALTKKLSPKATIKDVKELVQAHYNVLSNVAVLTEKQVGKLEVLELMNEMLEGAV